MVIVLVSLLLREIWDGSGYIANCSTFSCYICLECQLLQYRYTQYTIHIRYKYVQLYIPLSVINCGGICDSDNGDVLISSSTVGGVATYTCDAGYMTEGVLK